MDVKIKLLDHFRGLNLPEYKTFGSAGLDLQAANFENILIKPNSVALIPTGISIELPLGYEAQVRSRSGLALKNQIVVLNSPGTIDSDYRGEISVILMNFSHKDFFVERGMRIAQLVISKYEHVNFVESDNLSDSERSSGGFGSTGI